MNKIGLFGIGLDRCRPGYAHEPRWHWTNWYRSITLGSMAYYYEGTSGNEYENIVTS